MSAAALLVALALAVGPPVRVGSKKFTESVLLELRDHDARPRRHKRFRCRGGAYRAPKRTSRLRALRAYASAAASHAPPIAMRARDREREEMHQQIEALTEQLQTGGRPAFLQRFILAATLGSSSKDCRARRVLSASVNLSR